MIIIHLQKYFWSFKHDQSICKWVYHWVGPPKQTLIFITSLNLPLLWYPLFLVWISPVTVSGIISCINLRPTPTCDTVTQTNTELTQIFITSLNLPSCPPSKRLLFFKWMCPAKWINQIHGSYNLLLVIGHSKLTSSNRYTVNITKCYSNPTI